MKPFVIPTIFTASDRFSATVMGMSHTLQEFTRSSPSIKLFSNIGAGADSAFDKLVNLRTAAAGFFLFEAGSQLYEKVNGIAELGNQALKTSKMLGLSTDAFQELTYVAKLSDIAPEQLTNGLGKLNKNIGELKVNSGSLHTTLRAIAPTLQNVGLGHLMKDLQHVQNTDQAFTMIIGAIDKMPNSFKKAQLAQAAFGRGGIDMLKMLHEGPEGIARLREEARKYGGIIGGDAAASSEEFLDSQKKLGFAWQGLTNTLGAALIPKMQQLTEGATNWIMNNREMLKQKIGEWATKIGNGLQFLADHLDAIVFGVKLFIGTLIALKTISILSTAITYGMVGALFAYNVAIGLSAALTGVQNMAVAESTVSFAAYEAGLWVATAAQTAWAAALAVGIWPITLIALAIVALSFVIYEIVKHWNDWGAAITLFMGPLGTIISMTKTLADNWNMVKTAFTTDGMIGGLKALGKVIVDSVLHPFVQLLEIAARLTGSKFLADAAKGGEIVRAGLGVNMGNQAVVDRFTPMLPAGVNAVNPEAGKQPVSPLLNPSKAQQDALKETINTNNSNKNITVDFKNLPAGTRVTDDGGVMPNLGSTMGWM